MIFFPTSGIKISLVTCNHDLLRYCQWHVSYLLNTSDVQYVETHKQTNCPVEKWMSNFLICSPSPPPRARQLTSSLHFCDFLRDLLLLRERRRDFFLPGPSWRNMEKCVPHHIILPFPRPSPPFWRHEKSVNCHAILRFYVFFFASQTIGIAAETNCSYLTVSKALKKVQTCYGPCFKLLCTFTLS